MRTQHVSLRLVHAREEIAVLFGGQLWPDETHFPPTVAQEIPVSEHKPVVALHLLFDRVRVEVEQRLLAQVGIVWIQFVPLCWQRAATVFPKVEHWLFVQVGVF